MRKSIPERFHRSKARRLAQVGAIGGLMAGCGGGGTSDESVGSGGTGVEGSEGDDNQMQPLPGDVVQCCWIVTYGAALPCNAATCYSHAEEACLVPGNGTPCVDRQAADVDGDGSLGVSEVQNACGQVCLERGYDGTQPVGSSNMIPTDGMWDDPGGFVWNCSAIGTVTSDVVEGKQCTPAMFPDPPPFRVPTHIGLTHRDASVGQVQINVFGTSLRPVFDAATNLALFDCTAGGVDGGSCSLQLEGLSLVLAEPLAVGEHTIPSAELMLAGVVEAEVRFARCSQGMCTGHLQLSDQGGNPVGLGLGWVERHEPTRSTTTQYAPLSNGSAGFGGVSAIDGLVSLDPTASTGTLVLQGSGRDTFGDGALASALFRLELQLSSRVQP